MCEHRGVGELQCGGVVVCGSHGVGELHCGGVAVCGGARGLSNLNLLRFWLSLIFPRFFRLRIKIDNSKNLQWPNRLTFPGI